MTNWADFQKAAAILRNGGVVGMPTETVYGLAAAINQPQGIRRIFEIKRRPFFDPLIVHIAHVDEVGQVVRNWPPLAQYLAHHFWPGPMTLVLPKRSDLDPMICAELDTVGVRCPEHPFARRLIQSAGAPLAAPSANMFGKTSPTMAQHVRDEFASDDLFVLDGGPCEVGVESTVIELSGEEDEAEASLRILRPGMIGEDALRDVLKDWPQPVNISFASSAASPGHLASHYAPAIPLVIVRAETDIADAKFLAELRDHLRFPVSQGAELVLRESPLIAARMLYASLRELASSRADFLFVRRHDWCRGDEWIAIWDRLQRAATVDLS